MGKHRGNFWVFAYGSLMWRPGFPHLESRPGTALGVHRALCIYSHLYRGTPEKPGLVFGLDRGGQCRGLLFRVRSRDRRRVMKILHDREMNNRVYTPGWIRARLDGRLVWAFTFVARVQSEQYAGRLGLEDTITLVRQGHGRAGPCVDYVRNTHHRLRDMGVLDPILDEILLRL